MPKVTGQLTDFGFDALEGHAPRLLFIHNTPGVAGTSVLTTRPVVVPVAHNGYFEADLIASARIAPAGYYTVRIEWTEYPNRLQSETFPGRLYVPANGGALADILRVPANPALVWTGEEPPANPSPGTWWLGRDSTISEYDGTGWNFKQSIRGAAGYNATGAAADDSAIARFIGEDAGPTATARALERAVLNVRGFGAKGTGIGDDTAAIQAAINAAPESGGDVIIPHGMICRFTELHLNRPNVSIIGTGGRLTAGKIFVGSDSVIEDYGSKITGIKYDGGAAFNNDKSFIVMKRARAFTIERNTIKNTGRAIAVPPSTTGFHSVGMLDIRGNKFAGVDYAFHAETTAWDTVSDLGFIDNNVNYARISPFHATGLDGVTLSLNKLFQLNYSSTEAILKDKRYSVYIGTSDQLHITDNNIFEAGLDGIYLGSPTNINISGNHIVWPGQAAPSDAIAIHGGQPRGVIAGNSFVNFTKNAIGVYGGDPRRLEIGDNMYRWLQSPASYFGTAPLPSNRYRVFVDSTVAETPIIRDYYPVEVFDSIRGRHNTATDRKGEFQGISAAARRSVAVTGPDALIFRLTDIKGLPRHGGLVVVTARTSGANEAKTATYVLLISYTSTMSQCVQIASTGHTAGTAPDDPSFTWNVLGEHLRASPVGSTSHGSFWIEAISMGATALR